MRGPGRKAVLALFAALVAFGWVTATAATDREGDLIGLVTSARGAYAAAGAATARLDLQIQVTRFVREDPAIDGWRGTVVARGLTPEGDAWIEIEIADGVTLATWQSRRDDRDAGTLIKRHFDMFPLVAAATIGQRVVFSGVFVSSVLASDEEMVMRPRFIMRLSALTAAPD
jgi:hypothetical protein